MIDAVRRDKDVLLGIEGTDEAVSRLERGLRLLG